MRKVTYTNSRGDKLSAVLDIVSEDKNTPIFIISCGFSSIKEGSSKVFAKRLNENGFNAFTFDFFGHGESEGDFADITITEGVDDVLNAIKYLKNLGYLRVGLIGSSFGGITNTIAASKSNDIYLHILRCPISDYMEKTFMLKEEGMLDDWKKKGYTIYVGREKLEFKLNYSFVDDFKKNVAYDVAHKINAPTLIIHGDKDERVPLIQSQKLSKLIPDCKLKIIKGADHRFTNPKHFEKSISLMIEFIKEKT